MVSLGNKILRFGVPVLGALWLTACETPVPDSGAGVGFGDYSDYDAAREAELAGRGPLIAGGELSDETVNSGAPVPTGDSPAANATATAPAPAATPTPTPNRNNPGISDEQDFGAVASRETIESDAERRVAQQGAYQVIKPTALPTRTGGSNASVVQYALSSNNRVGQSIYRRSSLSGQARFQRNCAKYQSADRAQEAFLKSGGPERDPKGIDPDGDGFACFWDPSPYRLAVGN